MRRVLSGAGIALFVAASAATPQGLTIDWSHTTVAGGQVLAGQAPEGAAALELRADRPGGAAFHLVTIDRPSLPGGPYRVSGMLRYDGVEGQGYLEMWSVFPDSARYFTRTLAPRGALAALHGDSKWRRFDLPFTPGTQVPSRLEINVVFPGRGRVWIGPMRLAPAPAAWWSERAGLLFGVSLGSFLGILGGTIGVLAGRGRAPRAVLKSLTAMAVMGIALAIVGAAAILTDQPRYVWYPALTLGGLAAILGIVLVRPLRMRYAADELRRMQAMDARGARSA